MTTSNSASNSTRMTISDADLDRIAQETEEQWRRKACPNWMTRRFEEPAPVYVTVAHHETFPLGARSFTLEIRDRNTSDLLRRQRISQVD